MTIVSKIPRLRFGCASTSRRRVRAGLRERLYANFGIDDTAWHVTHTHIPPFVVDVDVDGRALSVALNRDRYTSDFWVVTVAPLVPTFPFSRHVVVPDDLVPGLLAVCRQVHATVTSMPGVHTPHWYFEWREYRSESVWTPDELPWNA